MPELIAKISEEFKMGLFKSIPGRKPPLFRDGRNMNFQELTAQPTAGQFLLFSADDTEYATGLFGSTVSGVPSIFLGTATKLYRWDETNGVDDRSKAGGYTGTDSDFWSFAKLGTWVAATNGVDTPQVDKGSDFVDLTGLTFTTAKIFRFINPHLIAFNTSNGDDYIEWSSADAFETWTPSSSNSAGNLIIRNLDTGIIAAEHFGKALAFYTENQMHVLEYTKAPFYFGSRKLLDGVGAVSRNSVVSIGRIHFGFSKQGIWMSDGTAFQFIDEPVHDFVYNTVDRTQLDLVCGWHNSFEHSVVFFFPTDIDKPYPTTGVGFDYETKEWTIFDFARTVAANDVVLKHPVAADRYGTAWSQSVVGGSTLNDPVIPMTPGTFEIEVGIGELGIGELGIGGYYSGDG